MRRRNLRVTALVVVVAMHAAAQPYIPFEFDAGLPQNPTLTQQKLTELTSKVPSWVQRPATFETLGSGPDGVSPPTVNLWFSPEIKAQFLRAGAARSPPMAWPAPVLCAASASFQSPPSLLAAGAPSSCAQHEAAVRDQLTPTHLTACLELEEPERYVHASRAPVGLSQSAMIAFVDQNTGTLEEQIALAGAGLSLVPVPDGLLPSDWVTTMRRVLWKIRPLPTARLADARGAFNTALATLTSQASCFDAAAGPALRTQLTALVNELNAVEAHVTQVVAQGTVQAAQQQQCLGAKSRVRPSLPYPALTDEEREFIAFWLGGVYWRMRGGALLTSLGTQNLRTFYARRPFREIARVASGTPVSQKAADAIYCNLFDGWGAWFDMGTTQDPADPPEERQDAYYDLVMMTNRGRQHVADFPAGAYVSCLAFAPGTEKAPEVYLREANYDTLALYTAGLSMGPCYLYGLNPLKNFTYYTTAQAPPPYAGMFEGHTTLGEFCAGASLGLGLTRSLLNGTPSGQAPLNLCGTRQCGTDTCGTTCGTCSAGMACDASGMCVSGAGGGTGTGGGSQVGGGAGGGSGGGAMGGGSGGGAMGGGSGGGSAGGGLGGGSAGGSADDAGVEADAGPGNAADGGPPPGDGEGPRGCGCTSTDSFAAALALLAMAFRPRGRARRGGSPAALPALKTAAALRIT